MSTPIIIILGVVILIVLISPFLGKKSERKDIIDQGNDEQAKEHIFSQLADLEYDFHMGKLSQKDFNKTKAELTAIAAKFVNPKETKLEQTKLKVDREIKTHLERQELEPNTGGKYES